MIADDVPPDPERNDDVWRTEVTGWLRANGIDPEELAFYGPLLIEEGPDGPLIRWTEYLLNADGQRYVDQDSIDDRAAHRERTAPLLVDPPAHWTTPDGWPVDVGPYEYIDLGGGYLTARSVVVERGRGREQALSIITTVGEVTQHITVWLADVDALINGIYRAAELFTGDDRQ